MDIVYEYIEEFDITIDGCDSLSANDFLLYSSSANKVNYDVDFRCGNPYSYYPEYVMFGSKKAVSAGFLDEWETWCCTPSIEIPDSSQSMYFILKDSYINISPSAGNFNRFEVGVYYSTGRQHPLSGDYDGNKIADYTIEYHVPGQIPQFDRVIEISKLKGMSVFFGIKVVKLPSVPSEMALLGHYGWIGGFGIAQQAEHEFNVWDMISVYERKEVKEYICRSEYNSKANHQYDFLSNFDRIEKYPSLVTDLVSKYHHLDENDASRAIIVSDYLRVLFRLRSIKKPADIVIEGYLDITTIDITQNIGDFCCSVTFSTITKDFYDSVYMPYIDIAGKEQRYYITFNIDMRRYNIIIEECGMGMRHDTRSWTYSGRSLQCLLDYPYGFLYKYVQPKISTGTIELKQYLRQIWAHATKYIHYFRNLIIGNIPYNLIPEDQLTLKDKSYIDIISELCSHFELMLIPHPNGDIEIKRKQEWIGIAPPVCPGLPIVNHTLTNLSAIESISLQESPRDWRNRIRIVGEKDGITGNVSLELIADQDLIPENLIYILLHSNNTTSMYLRCNIGKFKVGVDYYSEMTFQGLHPTIKTNEESTSLTNMTFRPSATPCIPFLGNGDPNVAEAIDLFGNNAFHKNQISCLDDGKIYSIAHINYNTGIVTLKKALPYQKSHIRYTFYGGYYGTVEWKAPINTTKDVIIRGWTYYDEAILRLTISYSAMKMKLYLRYKSVPADGSTQSTGRLYVYMASLPVKNRFKWITERGSVNDSDTWKSQSWAINDSYNYEEGEEEWKPTEEEILEEGWNYVFPFYYIPPNYIDEFTDGTLIPPIDDSITVEYGLPLSEEKKDTSININLVAPDVIYPDTNMSLYADPNNVNVFGNTIILNTNCSSPTSMKVIVGSTTNRNDWDGLQGKLCCSSDYYNANQGLTFFHTNPLDITDAGDPTGAEWVEDPNGGYIKCNSQQGSNPNYTAWSEATINLPWINYGNKYPIPFQVHCYHSRFGSSIASASLSFNIELPKKTMYIIASQQPFYTQYFYSGDTLIYCRLRRYIYVGVDYYISGNYSPFITKVCSGEWDEGQHHHNINPDIYTYSLSSPVEMINLMNAGSIGLDLHYANGNIQCFGEGDPINIEKVFKYSVEYGTGRKYGFGFADIKLTNHALSFNAIEIYNKTSDYEEGE